MSDNEDKVPLPQWIQDAYDALDPILAKTAKATPPSGCLFHFTDAGGLIGILKNHCLWATNARCLNDASEIRYGLELIRRCLSGALAEVGLRPRRREFRSLALEYLDLDSLPEKVRTYVDPFVVSFSETEEESYHWLHYGRGGDGYALGFEASKLGSDAFELRPVIYEEQEQKRMTDNAIEVMEEWLLDATAGQEDVGFRTLCRFGAHHLAVQLWGLATQFKHRSFRGEREWRLISFDFSGTPIVPREFPQVEMGFRPLGNRIVPYYVVDYRNGRSLPISKIVVGSRVQAGIARQSIKYLLREEKIEGVEVTESTVHLQ